MKLSTLNIHEFPLFCCFTWESHIYKLHRQKVNNCLKTIFLYLNVSLFTWIYRKLSENFFQVQIYIQHSADLKHLSQLFGCFLIKPQTNLIQQVPGFLNGLLLFFCGKMSNIELWVIINHFGSVFKTLNKVQCIIKCVDF